MKENDIYQKTEFRRYCSFWYKEVDDLMPLISQYDTVLLCHVGSLDIHGGLQSFLSRMNIDFQVFERSKYEAFLGNSLNPDDDYTFLIGFKE